MTKTTVSSANKFTHAESLKIDPEGKSILVVYYPENIDPERLEEMSSNLNHIRDVLARWVEKFGTPIYTKIKIGTTNEG